MVQICSIEIFVLIDDTCFKSIGHVHEVIIAEFLLKQLSEPNDRNLTTPGARMAQITKYDISTTRKCGEDSPTKLHIVCNCVHRYIYIYLLYLHIAANCTGWKKLQSSQFKRSL